MKLTILGNNGPYPAAGGACSGYLIESNAGEAILIDLGAGSLANLYRLRAPNTLAGIILSHLHFDHMSDMLPLKYALQFAPPPAPIPLICPSGPTDARNLLADANFTIITPANATLAGFSIEFIPAVHPIPSVSIKLTCDNRTLVYTGDTNINPALESFAYSADLLLADAGLLARDWSETSPHLSAKLCGNLARPTQAKRLLLTHLRPSYSRDDILAEAQSEYPKAEIAEIGRTYII